MVAPSFIREHKKMQGKSSFSLLKTSTLQINPFFRNKITIPKDMQKTYCVQTTGDITLFITHYNF
jgi:hypothetical protein